MFTRTSRVDYKGSSWAVSLAEVKYIKIESVPEPFKISIVISFLGDNSSDKIEIIELNKENTRFMMEIYYDLVTKWNNFNEEIEDLVTK